MDTGQATLVSGEGVALDLPTAGVASRAIAAAVDVVLQGSALLILLVALVPIVGASDGDALAAVVLVVVVAVALGYPVLCEWLGRGRTVGKMAAGLRVVRDDGGPVGFRQALVRGLVGLVLEKPGLVAPLGTFAAIATMTANPRDKRIGDLLAGTVVLNERAASQLTASPYPWVPPELVPWLQSLDLSGLDHRLAHSVRTFVSRAYAMSDVGRAALGEQLRERVLAVVTPAPPPGVPTAVLLQSVLAERRRRSDTGVAPTPVVVATEPGLGPPPSVATSSGFVAPS